MGLLNPTVAYGARYQSVFVPGAGRFIDYQWPDQSTFSGASPGRTRISQQNVNLSNPAFVGLGGGGGSGAGVLNGVPVWQVQSSGVAGNGNAIQFPNNRVTAHTSKNAVYENPLAWWRIVFVTAMFAAPIATGECTMSCVVDTGNQKWITGLNEGFGYQFKSDGTVAFATVKAGVLVSTVLPVQPAGGFVGVLHTYELRIRAACANLDAALFALVDGVPVALPATSSSWAAGTKLPAVQNVGGGTQPGFAPQVVSVANNVNSMYTAYVRIMAGPSFISLF